MTTFPTAEWVREWVVRSNASDEFRLAAQGWEGAVCLVVRGVPGRSATTVYIRLNGRDGSWTEQQVSTDPALATNARLVLTARYEVWKEVIRQELGPLKGILQGQIAVKGHLPDILKYRTSILVLCELAGHLRSDFLDD